MLEYAVLVAFLGAVIIAAMTRFQLAVNEKYDEVEAVL